MNDNGKIFDRALYRSRRARAATQWSNYDFLKQEAAKRLGECIEDIARDFPLALDVGCHNGLLGKVAGLGKVKRWVRCDIERGFAPQVVCDEEFLPFANESFDLVASALSLHHVNDLPGALIQIRRALKPGGVFIAILPGAHTLKELRMSFTESAAAQGFALGPRISPFVEVRDAGALLMRAGFSLPVADSDVLEVNYPDPFALMLDLQGMGEGNVLMQQHRGLTPPSRIAAAVEHYLTHHSQNDGSVNATFEFVTMTGWKE